jgi:simple sugar transport system permease protein
MEGLRFKSLSYRGLNTIIAFVILILIFVFFTPNHLFVDPRNLASMAKLIPDIGLVALGVGVLMICGEFDLSVVSTLPMCSYIFTLMLIGGVSPVIAFLITLPVGATLGLINGLITVKTGMSSFITTLGTMMFWRGVVFAWSHMAPISIQNYVPVGSFLNNLLTETIGFMPIQAIWLIFFTLVLGLILHFHKFGNWIYATGSNKEAARAMGVNTGMVKTICFMIVGTLCAFAAVMQSVRLGSFAATQGIGFELKAIAAAVVGGTSLRGGVGNIVGIFLGALTIQILENGLILMRVPVFGVSTFIGAAVIIFVMLNSFFERRIV